MFADFVFISNFSDSEADLFYPFKRFRSREGLEEMQVSKPVLRSVSNSPYAHREP